MSLTFNDEFMTKAIKRINELQEEIIEKSKNIDGVEYYIKKRLELFDKDEMLREKLKAIKEEESLIASKLFKIMDK